MTRCPLYRAGTTPENTGMKQEARTTSISSCLESKVLATMFLPSYTLVRDTWSFPSA